MGMSASQARFLQLTGRKNDIEYEMQQISFERSQLAERTSEANRIYNDKITNRKLTFTYSNGEGANTVDITYKNYKLYLNQQLEDLHSSQPKLFLTSSSGKIIVSSEEEITTMMEQNLDEDGNSKLSFEDFMIVDDLDNQEKFNRNLRDGSFYFATLEGAREMDENNQEYIKYSLKPKGLDEMATVKDELDTSDDAQAEADFSNFSSEIERVDKLLQMRMNNLETEETSIKTELESLQKIIYDDIEGTFKIFG